MTLLLLASPPLAQGQELPQNQPLVQDLPLLEDQPPGQEKPASGEETEGKMESSHSILPEGLFRLQFTPPLKDKGKEISFILAKSRRLESLILSLGKTIRIPRPLFIKLVEGETVTPKFDQDMGEIIFPYSILQEVRELAPMPNQGLAMSDAQEMVLDQAEWMVLHMVGHALVNYLEIQYVDRKIEETANALAILLAMRMEYKGHLSALTRAVAFSLGKGDLPFPTWRDFHHNHGLNNAHLQQMMCWVYGSNPSIHRYIIQDGLLSPQHSEQCMQEFELLSIRWSMVLEPHLK